MRGESDALIDCLIIGGGPAGLMAATYLGRFRRSVVVVDEGDSRAAHIPLARNVPGFDEGISGKDFLERLRRQAAYYGAEQHRGVISGLHAGQGEAAFLAEGLARPLHARTTLLATGVMDHWPDWPGLSQGIAAGLVRFCPICDGYETIGHKVGIVGPFEKAFKEALFLQTYTPSPILISLQGSGPDAAQQARLRQAGLVQLLASEIRFRDDHIEVVTREGPHLMERIYVALGVRVRSELALALGARHSAGCLLVDRHQQTSLPHLYAAGDVVEGLDQISVATGQAAVAATHIHNVLKRRGS